MKPILLAAGLLLVPTLARAQAQEQALVDRAALSVQEIVTQTVSQGPHALLQRARAALVCPRIFKAGFIFAGAGGDCVLASRAGNGTWSYPAFYTIGSASFGLQIGLQDSSLTMLIMTNRGLNAILNSHFKIGADASIALATIGGGVQGAWGTAIDADLAAFSATRGAFIGISLEGSLLNSRVDMNEAYYGRPMDARQIVIDMQGANPGADPLRGLLTRYGAPAYATPAARPAYASPPGYAPAAPSYAPAGAAQPPTPLYPPGYAPSYPPGYAAQSGFTPGQSYATPSAPIQQQTLPPPR
ncbi:MAG: lipid-binding SYLF domain-containing protein [Pseudomonadota bacterium]|nr:lipid-binding SYLF domain-containing protein [Pseudomonadota bacterium]